MSNLHRITWIDNQIRNERYPNCRQIAQQFEISLRQASRDVEYLRYSLGAPVAYSAKHNGYYYQGEPFALPAQFIPEETRDTLGYLAFQYRNREGAQARRLAELFSRLAGEAPVSEDNDIDIIDSCANETAVFKALKQAQHSQTKVKLIYVNAGNHRSTRVFCPYKIFSSKATAYVVGYCELREDFRTFRLERVREVVPTGERFQVKPDFDSNAYTGDFKFDREPFHAVVEFQWPPLALPGLQTERIAQRTLKIEFQTSTELLGALLGVRGWFQIQSPSWLRRNLHQRLQAILTANQIFAEVGHHMADRERYNRSNNRKEEDILSKQILSDVNMGMTWTMYIGAVEGALRRAGWWSGETYQLMGMTGIGFHFIIHKTVCPSSVTVYDWPNEHFAALDRIGVHSQCSQVYRDPRLNTFRQVQAEAIERIKESIDKGVPVVAWAPTGLLEFGLIYGYDDEEQVLFVKDCDDNADPVKYSNFGISEVPIMFYQTFGGRVEVDPEKTFRDSLEFAVGEWNKEQHTSPDYESGKKGYEALLATLKRGDFNEFGLTYVLAVYADAKENLAKYLRYVEAESVELQGLAEACKKYAELAEKFQAASSLVPFKGPGVADVEQENIPQVIELLAQCLELETRAMQTIEQVLAK
ncbi:MAG: WYL domain-containing protein [Firmicutes bacterium]|nr:WYL domain-containing protein [Bacillota bacterium]